MTDQEYAEFGEALLRGLLERGFGALPKREIDLLVFDLLTRTAEFRAKSNYELSTLLRIPESRVKALRLASALKYRDLEPEAILSGVVRKLTAGDELPELANGKIEIALEDPVEHREMVNFLKQLGQHAEYTFNSEVLRIAPSALFELIIDHVEDPIHEFDAVIQRCVEDADQAAALLKSADTVKAKFKRLREAHLKPEVVTTCVAAAAPALIRMFSA